MSPFWVTPSRSLGYGKTSLYGSSADERADGAGHCTLTQVMLGHVGDDGAKRVDYLRIAGSTYNRAVHEPTETSPFSLVYT